VSGVIVCSVLKPRLVHQEIPFNINKVPRQSIEPDKQAPFQATIMCVTRLKGSPRRGACPCHWVGPILCTGPLIHVTERCWMIGVTIECTKYG
jgi:hypothetical protein